MLTIASSVSSEVEKVVDVPWLISHAWVIPALMTLSFVLILFFGRRLPKRGAEIGITAIVASFVMSSRSLIPLSDAARRSSVGAKGAIVSSTKLVVAAVGRQRDSKGRTSYAADALSLASFRESSELEFGADDAFMLAPAESQGEVVLKHLKARHSEPRDVRLRFDGARQSFTPLEAEPPPTRDPFGLQAALAAMWNRDDDDEEEGGGR